MAGADLTAAVLPARRPRHFVPELAEPWLLNLDLRVRPIEFFRRLGRFQQHEKRLAREIAPYLTALEGPAACRVARTYAFADELGREVLRGVWPKLPPDGERALRLLSAAGVLLDQLLDESGANPGQLAAVRSWARAQRSSQPETRGRSALVLERDWRVLGSMLEDVIENCRRRAATPQDFDNFMEDLLDLYDAEAISVDLTLKAVPDERVRRLVRRKSVGMCWAGFRACVLGQALDPGDLAHYRALCDAMGEIMWILDDLADVEEDLRQGVWNRTLWRLYDAVGESRFRAAAGADGLFSLLMDQPQIVSDQVQALADRTAMLENHAAPGRAAGIRQALSFWVTAWLGVYA